MLPIYEAISFDKRIKKGGSTHPWIVKVQAENEIASYVVKIFTSKHIEQYNPVINEVLASILASEFNLLVPDPALIYFSDSFIELLSSEYQDELLSKDQRIKFGCRYLEGGAIYTPDLSRNFLKRYEIESIFAFDNLIQNVDRRDIKPNILLYSKEAYLIDHELSLSTITDIFIENFLKGQWSYNSERHIFLPYLKTQTFQSKQNCFNTFFEYLRRLDVNILDAYLDQLDSEGYDTENHIWIKRHLIAIKQNSDKFVNLLKQKIG